MQRHSYYLLPLCILLHTSEASVVDTPPILYGEIPLHPCSGDPRSTTFPLSITSLSVSRSAPHPFVWSGQLRLGDPFAFQISGTLPLTNEKMSTRNIKVALSLTSRTASLSGESPANSAGELISNLCAVLGYNASSSASSSRCPVLQPTVPPGAVSSFRLQSAGPLAVPTRTNMAAGVYDAQLKLSLVTPSNTTFYTCVAFQQVFVSSWLDYIPAVVAFTIASAASWHLGKAFPSIKLPIITGYLMIGVVVGPYVTNLVTRYHVWLLGQIINDVALSFIAFAAGEEIFFPELRDVLGTIVRQMKFITITTMSLVCVGFYLIATNSSVLGNWVTQQDPSCQIAIVLLLGIIMVGRSKFFFCSSGISGICFSMWVLEVSGRKELY